VRENDLVFIGPDADVMARMGDRCRRRSRGHPGIRSFRAPRGRRRSRRPASWR
jgi:hypothetical protein